jgi:DNA mismatch repair protein MutS
MSDNQKAPTPVMAQYLKAKEDYPDALVFFRMGDFYELFLEDAKTAAKALDIALTKRGQHNGEEIPMCGVPAHSAEGYLAKLVRSGFRVAICDQMESPEEAKKRGYKSIVRREVTRIITPGTLTEESLLDARSNNRLGALIFGLTGIEAALAWCDVSTGEFMVTSGDPQRLLDEASGLNIGEGLVIDRDNGRAEIKLFGAIAQNISPRPSGKADFNSCRKLLEAGYNVATLGGFDDFTKIEISALGVVYDYVQTTQAGALPKLNAPQKLTIQEFMAIDPSTRISLEIERSQKGTKAGSLLAAIDFTKTPQGGRQMSQDLSRPLFDINKINARFDIIEFLLSEDDLAQKLGEYLKQTPDLARPLSRIELGRSSPRDLGAIAKGLEKSGQIALALPNDAPFILSQIGRVCNLQNQPQIAEIAAILQNALNEDLPFVARDGGFIKRGFDPSLDEFVTLRDESRRLIAQLTEQVSQIAGQALKIKFNNVLGYFIEATPKQAPPLLEAPLNQTFIHRQTLAGMVRFTTNELIELNSKTARAHELALARELEIYDALCEKISQSNTQIKEINDAIARLDVSISMANMAAEFNCVRPILREDNSFIAIGARHIVVEASLKKSGGIFTGNDCKLDGMGKIAPRISLVTGPNMAGKSTYLRQNAVLAILAQAGCFVPATSFEFGIVDRVFSRVGASDDLASGQSTFMVEMVETAAILNRASSKSLVILDEIGRGTATFDGLAIAWAVTEHLYNINLSRTLFATHYHELTALSQTFEALSNLSLSAKDWNGELIFLHKVIEGAADRSYGVHVAKIAGLPNIAVNRARDILELLENKKSQKDSLIDDLPLFSTTHYGSNATNDSIKVKSKLEEIVANLNPEDISPKQALDIIYELKSIC